MANGASRFAAVMRRIMQPGRTLGVGVVGAITGQRDIALQGRPERVLVAGPMPTVGQEVGWARLDRSQLVACVGLRPQMPIVLRGHQAPFWADEAVDAIIPGEGVFSNPSPGCESDVVGRPWTLTLQMIGAIERMSIWRGSEADPAMGWAEAASLEWSSLPWPWWPYFCGGGPGGATPVMVIDQDGRFYAWWHRDNLWTYGHTADGIMQAAEGDIDSATGAIALSGPITITPPAVEGFMPGDWVPSAALEVDEQGYLWAAATLEQAAPSARLRRRFGGDLEEGWYGYAISPLSGTADELGPGGWAAGWSGPYPHIECTATVELVGPDGIAYIAGSFPQSPPGVYVATTAVGDNGQESLMSYPAGPFTRSYDNWGIRVRIYGAPATSVGAWIPVDNCASLRVYTGLSSTGPWSLFTTIAGNPQYTDVDVTGWGSGAYAGGSLRACSVRLIVGEGPPGTQARKVYRTPLFSGVPGQEPTPGYIGAVPGNTDDQAWDDIGGAIGAAPPHPANGPPYRAIVAGRGSQGSIAGGFDWKTVVPWAPHWTLGDGVGIAPLRDGTAVLAYRDADARLVAHRCDGGAWGAPIVLAADWQYSQLGTIGLFDHHVHLCWRGYSDADYGEHFYARLNLLEDALELAGEPLSVAATDAFPPRLSWHDRWEVLVMQAAANGGACVFTAIDGEWLLIASDPASYTGWTWAAPRRASMPALWALTWDGWADRVRMLLWRPL